MEAQELYDICQRLVLSEPSAQTRQELYELLKLTVARGCSGERGAYGNLFSQTDILCRRMGVSDTERQEIQSARRNNSTLKRQAPGTTPQADWPYDVRAVALLISAVFREPVPGSLRQLLPPTPRPREKGMRIDKRYVRCIVKRKDDTTIWADTAEGEITVDYGTTEQGRDFSYLRKILRPGMQLNLLDCHLADAGGSHATGGAPPLALHTSQLITPTVIIVEPDFLIDISALAACFTAYGHHPLLYTLNRMKPRPCSQATLLGNFAGVALDLLVHKSPNGAPPPEERREAPAPTPEESDTCGSALLRAFREDALRYLACPDYDPGKFSQEAERQTTNIAQAVDILSPVAAGHGGFLLEPSFVCEQLGLQGRVDLMTTDMSLLVEQKSGKNMKIEHDSHDSHGRQLESHYVQLLLYYATLRYNFRRGEGQVDTRLLYSRYAPSQGLLAVNYYRTLLREALKLRNQIVATELLIARDGFQRILPLLNADYIYNNVARDGYFHRYILPEIIALNARLSALTPLEHLYLQRMMTSVYREQAAARLGSSEQRLHHTGGAASDLWLMPLQEKTETGNIHLALSIDSIERSDPDAGFDHITLTCPDTLSCSNFRRGDMVYLYQYAGEPDVRRAILYKGTLDEITDKSITVALNDGQQNAAVFNNAHPWALEHGSSDAATQGCIHSLMLLANATPTRRALLMGQRQPAADTSLRLSRSYNAHYDPILQRIKQARDYFLLVGPPGTGKTSMALRFIVEEELSTHSSLLLTAYTNRAVDEICSMLEDAGTDYLRMGTTASCDPRFRSRLIGELARQAGGHPDPATPAHHPTPDSLHALIARTHVIVSTTSMLLARPYIFDLKHFSTAVVDEASQILEPALIGILASDSIDRFVLIGDHKQLPAVVQQDTEDAAITEQPLRDIGLTDARQSLFQRLYQWERRQGRQQFTTILTRQGRMHPDVASFPSSHFYGGQLLPVPIAHQTATTLGYDAPAEDRLDQMLKERRMIFLATHAHSATPTAQPATERAGSHSEEEARLVADLLRRIHRFYGDSFDTSRTVGVIVPYRSQIAAIRSQMASIGLQALKDITIDTVERYQGSQRDVIIYSFAVTRRYQLDFLTASTCQDENGNTVDRKLNVALTRARKQTIMVGDADILCHNDLFRQLIQAYQP